MAFMMKQLITIILVVGCGKLATAQTLNTYADTANYLVNEIAAKQSFYIGKPFSVLLDSLKIRPVNINSRLPQKEHFGKELYFDFNLSRSFSQNHFIIVGFENIPPYETLFPIFYPATGVGGNMDSIMNTYKPLIVKDITVKDYRHDDDPDPTIGVKKPVKN